ncbi:Flp pilus assembly protein RcpC/CpaB [Pseudomonas marincola]|uniref:Flp pilus assembly protein CpaB n=2 Tax=Pseudomonas TaxID=286 RepID=A0A653E394_9PSED|nr:Flp pilus assembly protein CpaB [Pseudomonas marincola]CAE6889407.1 Flp pilus assembly protein RcpC/CpaB [Pseudomonas marincola]
MDSRVTMALAAVMLLGAVAAGYWGVVMSSPPATESVAANSAPAVSPVTQRVSKLADDVKRSPVVVAVREISPFVPVVAEDLAIEQLQVAPAGSFSSIEEVVGRKAWNPIPPGDWLDQASFEAGGPLAQMIRPNERAVAVPVDEVVGGGGYLRPGDFVDVLLFMQEDGDQRLRTAQVALPAVRLLSMGKTLGPSNEGHAAQGKTDDDKKTREKPARTAVLAVPEQLVTRLLLASQAGTLRLAVRSADEQLQKRYLDGETTLVALNEQTRSLIPLDKLASQAAPQPGVAAKPRSRAVATSPKVEIYRGVQSTWQAP